MSVLLLLLHSYVAQDCLVASLAEGMAVSWIRFPLLVKEGILNLVMVPAIACLLFVKEARSFNVHQQMLADGMPS